MSDIWLDLSGKIDAVTISLFEQLERIFGAHQTPFVVIGATARDLVFHHGFGIHMDRSTADIDCAILIADWSKFDSIRTHLIESGNFQQTTQLQRLLWKEAVPVDLVPFGPVAGRSLQLKWPPDQAVVMSTLGLQEAHQQSRKIRLRRTPLLDLPVAQVPALAALKLIAWNDRPDERRKDASDLAFILRHYLDVGNEQKLHDHHHDLIGDNFDHELAGGRLLGRDIKVLMMKDTLNAVIEILARELLKPDRSKLITHMTSGGRQMEYERGIQLLQALRTGLMDKNA